jgi:hypothetical protein
MVSPPRVQRSQRPRGAPSGSTPRPLGALCMAALTAAVALGQPLAPFVPTFTGDSATDFPQGDPGVFVITDTQPDITWSSPPAATGWDLKDVRFAYDAATDTAYFSMRAACVLGDAVRSPTSRV